VGTSHLEVRFQVLMAVSMKMAISWFVALCSLVKFTDVSKAASISEISVNLF
jgi:hypothetical protein